MKPQDIVELEKKLKARELDVSKIDEKSHPKFGAVLTKNRAIIALVGAIIAAGGLLGLNSLSVWAQNFPGLFGGSSWGSIFGNGTSYMINGILSAVCETATYAAAIGAVSLVPNAIRGIVNYRQYKKMLDVNLTEEQKEKIETKELDYETAVTENLINKVNGRTHARSSAFVKAQDARTAIANTKNPFKKAKLAAQAKLNEDLVNKTIKTLIKRLNDLSLEKNNNWTVDSVNSQGLLVPKKLSAAEIIKKNEEMQKIQVFLAEVLDKSNKTDPYYACLKHYLKKYHKTIELVNLPSDKPEVAEALKNDITDQLVSGNIADAIKNFCTYSPYIIAKGKKTDLNATNDVNDFLISKYEAELEARKSQERVRNTELDMHNILERAKQAELNLQKLSIQGEGSATRLKKHEETFTERIENANEIILEAKQTVNELTKLKNDFISAFEKIVDMSNISKVHAKEIKNILTNSIKDRTVVKKDKAYIKNAKNQIKALLKSANEEHLFDDLERLIDLAFLSESHIAVIEANVKESQKSAKIAEEELKKATDSRKRTQGEEVTATLITGRMNQNMLDQKEKGDKHLEEMANKNEKASDILKEMEDKKAQINSIIDEVKDIVAELKTLKSNDVKTLKSNYIKIINELSIITNIQAEYEDRLDEIAGTMVASFSDIFTRLTKLKMTQEAQQFKSLFTELQKNETRLLSLEKSQAKIEKTQQKHGEQIAKLSKQFISLASDIKLLNNFVQNNTSLIELANNGYFTVSTEIKTKFITLVNLVAEKSTNQQLEEFASWTQHDLDKLTALVNQLKLQVTELQSSQPTSTKDEEDEETKKPTKYNVPMSEELAKQIKLYKNFAHAIHRALKDGKSLPTEAPTSMKGKKITQEEIASMGGKNMDFSSKGMFKQEVLEICEKHLRTSEIKFVKKVMNIELANQNETDIEALIGLIEKACENHNKTKGINI